MAENKTKITKVSVKEFLPQVKNDKRREGDICMIGFSPRSASLVLYLMSNFKEYESLTKKLGKFKTSKACIYINKLVDVDLDILQELINQSYACGKAKYG